MDRDERAHQKVLAGPVGSPHVEELRGVAVGIADDGRIVIARGCLVGFSGCERVRLAHGLADLIGELLGDDKLLVH